ncbi:ribonuclease HI [Desulfocapsa sulfexigens DSM 10523]|uniref:Ribonuclease H n=2 Tax=Desulfocapsa TaxID=53318 RepID=M1P8H4_DESSD|nr:ribonuclease HI [Desulfocapsa sulfexigens]AGF79783.1 ribonuclease HI [Desulfocapsa sulfexigens DSM 10523]
MALPLVTIYTDGSCSPNPGPGGWGVVILPENGKKRELSGKVDVTTNNRMELLAALKALQALPCPHAVELFTDSKYVKNGITKWIGNWRSNNWLTAEKEAVKNRDLWEALDNEIKRHEVKWLWVKGHDNDPNNERADALAVAARGRAVLPLSDETAIHIFMGITWKQKLQIGSWAAVFRYRKHFKIIGGVVKNSSANRIHIQSACDALRTLKRRLPVHLYTSSGYLKDGAGNWLSGWERNGWKTREGKVVSNKEEWQELNLQLQEYSVILHVIDKEMPPCHSQEAKELAIEYQQPFSDDIAVCN